MKLRGPSDDSERIGVKRQPGRRGSKAEGNWDWLRGATLDSFEAFACEISPTHSSTNTPLRSTKPYRWNLVLASGWPAAGPVRTAEKRYWPCLSRGASSPPAQCALEAAWDVVGCPTRVDDPEGEGRNEGESEKRSGAKHKGTA